MKIKHYSNSDKSYSLTYLCCPHKETSQLICCANQLTSFYMGATLVFNGLITVPNDLSF